MLEYLMNGANVVLLAGCVYAAYLVLLESPIRVRVSRKAQKARSDHVSHELLFRNPCAGYYI
jgi:hypothetical protein